MDNYGEGAILVYDTAASADIWIGNNSLWGDSSVGVDAHYGVGVVANGSGTTVNVYNNFIVD